MIVTVSKALPVSTSNACVFFERYKRRTFQCTEEE